MSAFNSESFPDSLVIATEEGLSIGTIDDIQKLHIRSVPLGEMPRRIAHQESSNTLCVLTVSTSTSATGEESETCFIRLIDAHTFEGK
jgi:DNA damage-binding protein 1